MKFTNFTDRELKALQAFAKVEGNVGSSLPNPLEVAPFMTWLSLERKGMVEIYEAQVRLTEAGYNQLAVMGGGYTLREIAHE